MYKEKRIDGEWLTDDMSQEVFDEIKYWGVDGHSHSFLNLKELKGLNIDKMVPISGYKKREDLEEFKASIESDEETDWGLLYPYCGGVYGFVEGKYEKFTIEVPLSFIINDCLDSIIQGLEKSKKENNLTSDEDVRVVFFFDS